MSLGWNSDKNFIDDVEILFLDCRSEIALKLEKGLLDLVFTADGREYLTHDHLRREVEDEMFVNGGRNNLVVLSKTLCVDLQKIPEKFNQSLRKLHKKVQK